MRMLIPIPILEYCLKERLVCQVRIFLLLKASCSGSLKLDYDKLYKLLKIKSKISIQKHLLWLNNNGWINIYNKFIYLRSWKRIYHKINETRSRTGVYIDNVDPLLNNQIFKAFAAGAIFSLLLKYQKSKRWKNKYKKNNKKERLNRERGKGRSELRDDLFPSYFGISNSILCNRLNISKTHAIRLKKLSEKHKFIKTFKKIAPLDSDNERSKYIKQIRKSEDLPLIVKNGILSFQSYDEIISNMALGVIPKNRILY